MNAVPEFDKVYELPMKRDYVSNWGLVFAVRELLQNALDHSQELDCTFTANPDTVEDARYCMRLHSSNVVLSASSLVLGETTKRNDTQSVGTFGEGFKLALLVLARLNCDVTIYNGGVIWIPGFHYSKTFDSEVFCIAETPAGLKANGLTYILEGLTYTEISEIQASCLQLQPPIEEVASTTFGTILPRSEEEEAKLYINGLFVCDTELHYSYNVHPEHLRLGRDRESVSGFNLQWLTKRMWLETQRWDDLCSMIEQEIPDLEYIHYDAPEILKELCYQRFRENNPGTIMATSQEHLQELIAKGMTKVIYSGGCWGVMVSEQQPSYAKHLTSVRTPQEILVEFTEEYASDLKDKISEECFLEFERIVEQSAKWHVNTSSM